MGFAGLFEIQHLCVQNVNRANPDFFLRFLDMVNGTCYFYVLAYAVWFKKDAILAVFGEPDASPYIQKVYHFINSFESSFRRT